MIVSFGGVGGIFATTVFRQADFPAYLPGIYATIACQVLLLLLLALLTLYYWKHNRRVTEGRVFAEPGQSEFVYTL